MKMLPSVRRTLICFTFVTSIVRGVIALIYVCRRWGRSRDYKCKPSLLSSLERRLALRRITRILCVVIETSRRTPHLSVIGAGRKRGTVKRRDTDGRRDAINQYIDFTAWKNFGFS